jgi:hypothetical protein
MDIIIKILNNRRNKRILSILAKEIRLQHSENIKVRASRIIKGFKSEKELSDFLMLLEESGIARLEHINSNGILNSQIISRPAFHSFAQNIYGGYGLGYNADMILICNALKINGIMEKIKGKITIYFSKKYGIYSNPDYKEKGYPISGGRKRIIWKLKEKDIDHTPVDIKEEGLSTRNLSRDMLEINAKFKKILGFEFDLIKHYPEEYYLNLDDYEVKIEKD